MKYEGIYKAIKAAKHVEGEGLTYEDIDKLLAETTDPGMKHIGADGTFVHNN